MDVSIAHAAVIKNNKANTRKKICNSKNACNFFGISQLLQNELEKHSTSANSLQNEIDNEYME